ncbi:hypothetical protein [Paractinoplanes toevensis]|uniref:Uncharacterized protein n=1 Tax=Paractinoplanes toevensis TaxID=571911 RepID=A0A919T8A5_9ACTN|nr:hypothetical protein [Actinoplanes toevensis]GIM89411.1 hypothetical protein Ato02nite_012040 [Actinoplanes toevensis]
MTEDSQSNARGYGPLQEGAEPTAPIVGQSAGYPPADTVNSAPPAHPQIPVQSPAPPAPGAYPGGDANYPQSAPHTGGYSTGPDPMGGLHYPAGGAYPTTYQTPGSPVSGIPTSADPASGAPAPGNQGFAPSHGYSAVDPRSGNPYATNPTSGNPYGYGPFQGESGAWPAVTPSSVADPLSSPPSSFGGRRIAPSPAPSRGRLFVGVAVGLVAGLLLFGTGGWFAGRATAPEPAEPTAAVELGKFEQNQAKINKPVFAGTDLDAIVEGWLPYVSDCKRSGQPGGPTASAGETTRVACNLDGLALYFIEYNSVEDQNAAWEVAQSQNLGAHTLTPGVLEPFRRPAPSNRVQGHYAENASRVTEGGETRTVAGLWWDDENSPISANLVAYWEDQLGGSWLPMRDLWDRYA